MIDVIWTRIVKFFYNRGKMPERVRLWLTLSPAFFKVFVIWAGRAGLKPQDFAQLILQKYTLEMATLLGVVRKGEDLPTAATPNRGE